MKWVAFTYSLPSKPHSTRRVSLWRRLRRLGAISPAGSVYLLPAHPECVEAFQWLLQEIRQAQGDAFAFIVERLEGIGEQQLVDLFNLARQKEYEEIEVQVAELYQTINTSNRVQEASELKDSLEKMRRAYAEVARIDYFHCTAGFKLVEQLYEIERALAPNLSASVLVRRVDVSDYQGKVWVTRPRPYVDRLACAWLIHRFIDPAATIRYADTPETDEISFDMSEGHFSHTGNRCTFETMLLAFGLDEPGLQQVAEIVHEIDLRDGRFARPEVAGTDAVLNGWHLAGLSDHELEVQGTALFEGLYLSFQFSSGRRDGLTESERATGI
jgi:hypothetical protein